MNQSEIKKVCGIVVKFVEKNILKMITYPTGSSKNDQVLENNSIVNCISKYILEQVYFYLYKKIKFYVILE